MYYRRLVVLFTVLAVLFFNTIALAREVAPVSSENCLWKVSSGKNSLYLQGSIHLLKETDYPISQTIEKAFNESDVVVLEVDLGDPATQKAGIEMLSTGMLPPGKTLEKCLSRKTFEMAKKKTAEGGMDISVFSGYKPWFFAMTLTSLQLTKSGFSPHHGIDFYFWKKAEAAGKQVEGLETLAYQISLFDNLPENLQDEFVRQTIEDMDSMEKQINELVSAWRSGNIKNMEVLLFESLEEYPKIYDAFFVKRNKAWMKKIEHFLKQDKVYMVIVGAGHMVGKDGLVEMCRKKGYSVKQK